MYGPGLCGVGDGIRVVTEFDVRSVLCDGIRVVTEFDVRSWTLVLCDSIRVVTEFDVRCSALDTNLCDAIEFLSGVPFLSRL
jgi:hypothetical protein